MTEQIEGTVKVCCHRVTYRYETENLTFTEDNVKDITERLETETESRAKEMINEGNNCGELNCLIGEIEVRGWWEIE